MKTIAIKCLFFPLVLFVIGSLFGCQYSNQSTNVNNTEHLFQEVTEDSNDLRPSENNPVIIEGIVTYVSDGDTLIVENLNKYKYIIRLQGIDAPERDQLFGEEAKVALKNLLENKSVVIETTKTDRYGRLIGKIFSNNKDICLEMIRLGFAWHFKRYENEQSITDRKSYEKAEIYAKKVKLGLWKDKKPIAPWDFRDLNKEQENSN